MRQTPPDLNLDQRRAERLSLKKSSGREPQPLRRSPRIFRLRPSLRPLVGPVLCTTRITAEARRRIKAALHRCPRPPVDRTGLSRRAQPGGLTGGNPEGDSPAHRQLVSPSKRRVVRRRRRRPVRGPSFWAFAPASDSLTGGGGVFRLLTSRGARSATRAIRLDGFVASLLGLNRQRLTEMALPQHPGPRPGDHQPGRIFPENPPINCRPLREDGSGERTLKQWAAGAGPRRAAFFQTGFEGHVGERAVAGTAADARGGFALRAVARGMPDP